MDLFESFQPVNPDHLFDTGNLFESFQASKPERLFDRDYQHTVIDAINEEGSTRAVPKAERRWSEITAARGADIRRQWELDQDGRYFNANGHYFRRDKPNSMPEYSVGQYEKEVRDRHLDLDNIRKHYGLEEEDIASGQNMLNLERDLDTTYSELEKAGKDGSPDFDAINSRFISLKDQFEAQRAALGEKKISSFRRLLNDRNPERKEPGVLQKTFSWIQGNGYEPEERRGKAWGRFNIALKDQYDTELVSPQEMAARGKLGFLDTLREVADNPTSVIPFLQDFDIKSTHIQDAAIRQQDGFQMYLAAARGNREIAERAYQADRSLLEKYKNDNLRELVQGVGFWKQAGDVITQLPAYGAGIAVTGFGAGALAKGLSKLPGAAKLIADTPKAVKLGASLVGNTVYPGRVAGLILPMAARLTNQQMLHEAVRQDESGNWFYDPEQVSPGTMFWDNVWRATFEVGSEMTGPVIGETVSRITPQFIRRIGSRLKNTPIAKIFQNRTLNEIRKKAHIDGVPEEVLEETLNNLACYAFALETSGADDPEDFLDRMLAFAKNEPENMAVNAGIFAVLPAAGLMANTASTLASRRRQTKKLNDLADHAKTSFDEMEKVPVPGDAPGSTNIAVETFPEADSPNNGTRIDLGNGESVTVGEPERSPEAPGNPDAEDSHVPPDVPPPSESGTSVSDDLLPHEQVNPVREETPQPSESPSSAASEENIYMRMPIERVLQDAENGVLLAKKALALRQSEVEQLNHMETENPEPVSEAPENSTEADSELRILNRTLSNAYENGKAPQVSFSAEDSLSKKHLAVRNLMWDTFRKRIVYFEGKDRNLPDGASIGNDAIYVNRNASNPYLFVALHEYYHEKKGTELGREIADVLMNSAQEGSFRRWMDNYNANLDQQGYKQLDAEDLKEEFVADSLGMIANRESFWKEMAREKPNLLQNFLAWIRDLKESFSRRFRNGEDVKDVIHDMERAERMITNIMKKEAARIAESEKGSGKRESLTFATPQGEMNVNASYEVVDVSDLVTSDMASYDKVLQPRNRDSASSVAQIEKISSSLNPSLLLESPTTDTGAPLIDGKNQVISGNGRSIGIRKAVEKGRAGEYQETIRKFAQKHGIKIPQSVKNPVLVRRISGKVNLEALAEFSNRDNKLQRSEAEQAEADAKTIVNNNLLSIFNPAEDGTILTAQNSDFTSQFIYASGDASMLDSEGRPSGKTESRIRNAILGALFLEQKDSRDLIRRLIEQSGDLGLKRQIDGVSAVAGRLLQISESKKDYDLRDDLAEAFRKLLAFKKEDNRGKNLSEALDAHLRQQDFFSSASSRESELLFRTLGLARSVKQIREFLSGYADTVDRIDPNTENMFGMDEESKYEILSRLSSGEQTPDLFGNSGELPPSGGTHTETQKDSLSEADEKLIEEYRNRFGNVLNTDNMKLLFPGYNPHDEKSVRDNHPKASGLIGKMFDQAVEKIKPGDTVIFTGGGNGSGKSSVLEGVSGAAFVMDSTMANDKNSGDSIQKVLDKGGKPVLAFTYRDPVDAWFHGVQKRNQSKDGHVVPKTTFANTHVNARESFIKLAERFAGKVDILIYENHSGQDRREITLDELKNKKTYTKEEILEAVNGIRSGRIHQEGKRDNHQNTTPIRRGSDESGETDSGRTDEVLRGAQASSQGNETEVKEELEAINDLRSGRGTQGNHRHVEPSIGEQSAGTSGGRNTETGRTDRGTETASPGLSGERKTEIEEENPSSPSSPSNIPGILNAQLTTVRKASLLRKYAKDHGMTVKQMQEAVEAHQVKRAWEIARDPKLSLREKFERILAIYEQQPPLNERTSGSIQNQAYSTPLPLAFLCGEAIHIGSASSVYEPTAGNGALLISADPSSVHANEIDAVRRKSLEDSNIRYVTSEDATNYVPGGKFDAVIMNPPFGTLKEKIKVNGFYNIGKLEHLIAVRALKTLAPDGRAAMILGANLDKGKITNTEMPFMNYLYNNFKVSDNFEVDGSLYRKQGASYPVRVILLSGRLAETDNHEKDAPKTVDRLDNWNDIYKRMEGIANETDERRKIDDAGIQRRGMEGERESPQHDSLSRSGEGASENIRGGVHDAVELPSESVRGGAGRRSAEPEIHSGTGKRETLEPAVDGGRSGISGDMGGRSNLPDESALRPSDGSGTSGETGRGSGGRAAQSLSDRSGDDGGLKRSGESDSGEAVNALQNRYRPQSNAESLGTVIPKFMRAETARALATLKERHGDIDEFVRESLGYDTKEELYGALAAEQIDSVALAIDNIDKGESIIIGDQTGIGKGRQAAAIMRYAKRNGIIPVFFTETPKLFSDMYSDGIDIGERFKPFLIGDDKQSSIVDSENKLLQKCLTSSKQKEYFSSFLGKNPLGFDSIFCTYSQVNTKNKQIRFFYDLASKKKIMLVMDEAHNASGIDSNTGMFFHEMLSLKNSNIQGSVFLSATYAKRPDNMNLFSLKNKLGKIFKGEKLVETIQDGGLALQQVISQGLAEAGQLIRRERDFSGVKVNMDVRKVGSEIEAQYDKVSNFMSELVQFSEDLKESMVGEAKAGKKQGIALETCSFGSIVHNYIGQLIFASKLDIAAQEIIKAAKNGQKPVVALSNTLESFLKEYMEKNSLSVGDAAEVTFRDVLFNALEKMKTGRVTDKGGNSRTIQLHFKPEIQAMYNGLLSKIDEIDVDLPASPIDYLKAKLEAAGLRVGELTGRENIIQYDANGKNGVFAVRSSNEKASKNQTVNDFNSGRLDVVILNRAGATGLSLHSSEKFKDRKQRHMFIVQADLDINIVQQMLGRVLRSGQVNKPEYTFLSTDLEAERRVMSILKKKMASLSANTTANTKSGMELKGEDFLNKYGDQVVSEFLFENPIYMLRSGISVEGSPSGKVRAKEDIARNFTGKMALFSNREQRMIYDELSARYSDLVNRLKATGDYDLEITDKDWRAQELSSENYDGGDPDGGIFEKPLVMKTLKTHEKLKVPDRRSLTDDRMKYFGTEDIPEMREKLKAMFDEQRGRLDDYYAELLRDAGDAREKVKLIEEKGKYRKELERLETYYRNFLGFPLTIQEGETSYHGTISNIRFGKTGNPGAASNIRVSFLVESPVRISAQASQIGTGKNIQIFHAPHGVTLDTIFNDRGTREFETERRVFVGNILKGVAAAEGNGKIVRYTTSDGRTEMGVAMPSVFRMSDLKNDPRRKLNTEDEILRYLNRYRSVTGDFGLEIVENYGDYRIFVDRKKNSGGQIYLDPAIRDIVGDFRQNRYRNNMELEQHTLDEKTFRRVLPLLMEKTQISGDLENMRKFRGSEPAKLSVPWESGFQENTMASSDTPVETVSISTQKHYLTSQADTILRARIRKEQEKTGNNYLNASNRMTGMTARITTGSASKMRSGKAVSKSTVMPYVHAAAMLNLEKLFDRAMLGISHDDRKHSESVIRMHRFFVGMDYEGKRYGVKMTVKEMREGFNHLYSIEAHDIQIEEMKNPGSEEPSGDMARSQLPKEAGEPWAISGDKTPAVWKNLVFKDFFEKFHIPDHTVSDSGENVKSETENIPPELSVGFSGNQKYAIDADLRESGKEKLKSFFEKGRMMMREKIDFGRFSPAVVNVLKKYLPEINHETRMVLMGSDFNHILKSHPEYTVQDLYSMIDLFDHPEKVGVQFKNEADSIWFYASQEKEWLGIQFYGARKNRGVIKTFYSPKDIGFSQKNRGVRLESVATSDISSFDNTVANSAFSKTSPLDHTVSGSGENVKSETENIPPESAPGRPAKLSVPGMERDGNRIRGFFSALFEKDVNAKTDVNPVAKHLGTIFHYSRKVPSLFRTYLAASEIVTDKTKIRDWILNGNTGRDIFAEMSAFKKRDPEHYRKMNEYLLERDKNRDGLDVALRKDEKGMEFFAVVRKGVGTVSGRYESEDEAWEIAWSMERRDLADAGFGEEAAEFVYQWRHIFNRQWLEFKGKWDEVKKSYEDAGEEVPFIDGIDLDAELNKMGRLRGSYFPRIRHGNLLIHAEKEGKNPRTEAFTNQVARAARAAQLRGQGYHVTLKRSERPSEEAFSASSVAALNDFVNNAFNRMNAKSSTTFRDFGLMPEYEEYTRKDGTKETHLILRGNKRRFDRILKNFGGQYYKDGWRFRNVDPAFEKSLLQAVAVHVGVVSGDVNLFGKVLAEQLALLIHSHGSRSAMIGRSDATGKDVHLGYEEDALTAMALSVSSAAGGSAKGIAARKMLRAFTGTDVSFESWLKQEYPDESKRPEDYGRLYEEYRAFVDDRRIDSALQPRAFKSGTDFMTDVMRNDTDTEHVIGVLRGVMATYYLSRPSSGIINLSTMFTNVPAMMSAYGGVSIRRAGVLLSQESKRYLRYLLWNKYGKGKNLSEEDAWVYRKIHEYGWDESQMSDEMAGEIMTWGSRAWRKITGTGLLVFASTEQFNRNVTIAAAFRGLMEREKGTVTEARREELLRKAKNDISDRAHGVYGKINLPDAMRGASAGAQVFRSFYSYKTYTHNYLQSLLALGLKRPKETAWMVLSPAVLAGAPATVLTPLAALVFSSLGLEPPDGVEAEFYRWMRRTFGTSGERFGRMGVAGLAGVNLTGSMSMMGVTELPTSLEEVLGAPYSMSENIVKGIGDAAHGNFGKAAERILPAMLSAPVKAAREAVRGVTKKNNQPVIYEGEALHPDTFDTVMRSLGFNPASISEKREKLWEQQRASSFYRKQRSEIYNEMRDWYVSGRKSGEWARILRDVEEYNARVRRSGRENIPLITEEVIKRTIRNASKGR